MSLESIVQGATYLLQQALSLTSHNKDAADNSTHELQQTSESIQSYSLQVSPQPLMYDTKFIQPAYTDDNTNMIDNDMKHSNTNINEQKEPDLLSTLDMRGRTPSFAACTTSDSADLASNQLEMSGGKSVTANTSTVINDNKVINCTNIVKTDNFQLSAVQFDTQIKLLSDQLNTVSATEAIVQLQQLKQQLMYSLTTETYVPLTFDVNKCIQLYHSLASNTPTSKNSHSSSSSKSLTPSESLRHLKQRTSPNTLQQQYIQRQMNTHMSPRSAPAYRSVQHVTTESPRSLTSFALSQPPLPRSTSPHKLYTNTSNAVDVYPELHYSSSATTQRTSRISPNKLTLVRSISDNIPIHPQSAPLHISPQAQTISQTSSHSTPIIRTEQQLHTFDSPQSAPLPPQMVQSPVIIPLTTMNSMPTHINNNKLTSKQLCDTANSSVIDNGVLIPITYRRSQSVSAVTQHNTVPDTHIAKIATQALHARNGSKSNRRLIKSPTNALHTSQSMHDGIVLSPPNNNRVLTVPSPPQINRSQSQPNDNPLLSPLKNQTQLQRKLAINTQQNTANIELTSPKSAFVHSEYTRYDTRRKSGTLQSVKLTATYDMVPSKIPLHKDIASGGLISPTHNKTRFSYSAHGKPVRTRPQSVYVGAQQRPPIAILHAVPVSNNVHIRSKSAAPISVNNARIRRIKSPTNAEQQAKLNYVAWMNSQPSIQQQKQPPEPLFISAPSVHRQLCNRVPSAEYTMYDLPSPMSHSYRNSSARSNSSKYHYSGRFKSADNNKQRSPTEIENIDPSNYNNIHTSQSTAHSLHSLYTAQNTKSDTASESSTINYSTDSVVPEEIDQPVSPPPVLRVLRITEIDEDLITQ